MSDVFGVPLPAVASQLLLGVVNGSFYALLSLGLTVIFGMLNVVNFAMARSTWPARWPPGWA